MAGKIHNGPNGPGRCKAKAGGSGCPFDPESTGANHFDTKEEAQIAYETKMESEHGLTVSVEKSQKPKRGLSALLKSGKEAMMGKPEELSEQQVWHNKQMELLAPIAEKIEEKYGYHALGTPRKRDSGITHYWLNGGEVMSSTGRKEGIDGWYSLQELEDELYIEDMEVRAKKNFEEYEYDHNGKYLGRRS